MTTALSQAIKGSPRKPCGHEQIGLWSLTSQLEFCPQAPMQGSRQLKLKQARLCGHSWSYSHSPFLQETNGSPWNPAGHLHVAVLPVGMHSALGPQGFGLHGSGFSLQPEMVSGMGT